MIYGNQSVTKKKGKLPDAFLVDHDEGARSVSSQSMMQTCRSRAFVQTGRYWSPPLTTASNRGPPNGQRTWPLRAGHRPDCYARHAWGAALPSRTATTGWAPAQVV